MFKYLHEILGLLHDFMTEAHDTRARQSENDLAADRTIATAPHRHPASAALPRRAP